MAIPTRAEQLSEVKAELARSFGLTPYEAVDAAWVAILKACNMQAGTDEHQRMAALLQLLPVDDVRPILKRDSVETLLSLDPPLESILTAVNEELDAVRTGRQLAVVLAKREAEPHVALTKLVSVLRRVRNRRMHGFKTVDGPRDNEILSAATDILQQVGSLAARTIQP